MIEFVFITAILALLFAWYHTNHILKQKSGNDKMNEIADAIKEGAMAYLARQYKVVAVIAAVIFAALYYLLNWQTAVSFIVGAFLSALAGFIGMSISVRTNVRTAQAARKGIKHALDIAFRGGTVVGFSVVGMSLLGVVFFYWLYGDVNLLIGFGFGASLISLFARVGGGIFTKAADVGADLVGKIEAGIPEDDPRNPAVIADNVGDNVGDCAGMGADLFETYAVTMIAAMLLGSFLNSSTFVLFPLALGALAIVSSILSTFFVKLGKSKNIMGALYKGLFASTLISVALFYFAVQYFSLSINMFYITIVGLVITVILTIITDYFTSKDYGPV
ncbi:sodium-translocating pyrophosphatase, partial [Candidatus Woesearchaeota archaeon]|nr:sodium-translocating pyrophosphatase [Candidatus Woesearchaeota archaeon]